MKMSMIKIDLILVGVLIIARCILDYIEYKEELEDMREDEKYDREHEDECNE